MGLAAAILAGCAQGPRMTGAGVKFAEAEDSAAFLDRISSQPSVTENDAFRGILLLLDGKDSAATFADRVKALESRRIVNPAWTYSASRAITRGKLAYMVYQACKMQGGLTLTLAGPTERYCLREMQFIRMFGPGAVYGDVSGMELVSVLNRADDYMHKSDGKFSEAVNASDNY